MSKNNYPWALVLSGGGARGLAHIGVLKALEEMGFPKPSLIAGTSMGAIVGGLYACGMTANAICSFTINNFKITDYLDSFVFKISGPVGKVFQTGQVMANLAVKPGIDTGNNVLELFEELTGGKNFTDTQIPFRCNALDLISGKEIVFRSGSVARAIRASMSFPLFFEPLMEQGMCLVDGGLWDNMPVTIAREEGFRRVLAVNSNQIGQPELLEFKNVPQVILRSIECFLSAMEHNRKVSAGLTLNVSSSETPFSFFKQKELIELGEQVVKVNKNIIERFFMKRSGFSKKPLICGIDGIQDKE